MRNDRGSSLQPRERGGGRTTLTLTPKMPYAWIPYSLVTKKEEMKLI